VAELLKIIFERWFSPSSVGDHDFGSVAAAIVAFLQPVIDHPAAPSPGAAAAAPPVP